MRRSCREPTPYRALRRRNLDRGRHPVLIHLVDVDDGPRLANERNGQLAAQVLAELLKPSEDEQSAMPIATSSPWRIEWFVIDSSL